MKKYFFFSFFLLLGISLFVYIYKQFNLESVSLRFRFLSKEQILILFLLTFYRFWAWVVRWQLILKSMGIKKIPFRILFGARLGEMSLSYLTPGLYYGGELVRVWVLKKERKNIPLSQITASIVLDRIIEIGSFGVFTLISVFILLGRGSFFQSGFFLLLGFLPLILVYFIFQLIKSKQIIKLVKFFRLEKLNSQRDLTEGFNSFQKQIVGFFKNSPRTMIKGIVLSLSTFLVGAIQIFLFINFSGEFASIFDTILIRTLNLFSELVPIPATLGVFEGVNILGFQLLKLNSETGLGFTIIKRLIDFVFVVSGLLVIGYYSFQKIRQSLNKKDN